MTFIVLALVGMLTVWRIHDDHQTTLQRATYALGAATRIADEQISGALRAADLLMRDVGHEWMDIGGQNVPFIENYLKIRMAGLPELTSVIISDAQGMIVASNLPTIRNKPIDFRDHFKVPQNAPDQNKLFVFPPFLSKENTVVVTLSRAMLDNGGNFKGVIAAALFPKYFQGILRSVTADDAVAVSLTDRQGNLLVRNYDQNKILGQNIGKGKHFQDHRASKKQLTIHRGLVIGKSVEYLLAIRTLDIPSLVVTASKPMDLVLAPCRNRSLIQISVYLAIGFIAVFLVVVAQRRQKRILDAEYSLSQALALNRSIVKQAQVGMALYRSDGTCLLANASLADLMGLPLGEVYSQNFIQGAFWRETGLRDMGLEVLATGQTLEPETRTGEGETRQATRWMISRITHQDQGHLLIIAKDITNFINVQKNMRNLELQLHQSQKMEALGTLAGGMAHDFNNILSAIMGFSELAQVETQRGQDCSQELAHIYKSAERATALIRQIMTFSRKVESDLKPIDLNAEIMRAVEVLKRTIPKMIDIQTDLAGDLKVVNADATQIEQVLINLANNAADAMPEGGLLEFSTANVVLDEEYIIDHLDVEPGEYALLQVSDNGCGMDKETQERIFEPFFTTKEKGKGTGLGLATAYAIIKNHKGHLYCYSEVGSGTTFKIYLPIWVEGGMLRASALPEDQALPGGDETILLVDDEEYLRAVGARLLSDRGYTVLTAQDGERGLEKYRAHQKDIKLVILDLNMPGMGGHKCLKELLAINPETKVIIISGYARNDMVKSSLESGALAFVPKPFRRTDLLTTVRRVLDGDQG